MASFDPLLFCMKRAKCYHHCQTASVSEVKSQTAQSPLVASSVLMVYPGSKFSSIPQIGQDTFVFTTSSMIILGTCQLSTEGCWVVKNDLVRLTKM